jgi:hypothetical protein
VILPDDLLPVARIEIVLALDADGSEQILVDCVDEQGADTVSRVTLLGLLELGRAHVLAPDEDDDL